MMKIKQNSKCERLYKLLTALAFMCLSMLLTACGSSRTEYVTMCHPTAPSLLADITVPIIPDRLSFGDSVDLNIETLAKIRQCNIDKRALREIEALRDN